MIGNFGKNKFRKKIVYREYVADFETSVYEGQTNTEVWAAASVALDDPDDPEFVDVMNSLDAFMEWCETRLYKNDLRIYFHNLKFDDSFIMCWLLSRPDKFKLEGEERSDGLFHVFSGDPRDMKECGFTYVVSSKGIWYNVTLKWHGHILQFVDSLKLLPFTVNKIGKAFETKHRKLEMEYEGERHAGGEISEKEEAYIKNDVLVVKEALNIMKEQGHDKLTIGGCCMDEFKECYDKHGWNEFYPDLYHELDEYHPDCPVFSEVPSGYASFGDYIRASYHGGWCYVVPEKANKEYFKGTTADVNSLYPSMLHSESGNKYPIGLPTYWKGAIPPEALYDDKYYFVRVKTRFKVKEGYLPTIQIKTEFPFYNPREWLTTSDWCDVKGMVGEKGKWYKSLPDGSKDFRPELVLTMTDWELMNDHYDLYDTEIIDGCYFDAVIGLFDDYINKYAEIKMKATGALRQLAKLFLNNLYGRFSMSCDSSGKIFYLNDEGALRSYEVPEFDKNPGYIPIGSACTSYARRFTITAAQKNYHGIDRPGFIYADTDSIHCDLLPDEIVGAPEDPVKFNHWKYEAQWDYGKFIRAKTYVEHVTGEDRKPVNPYYNLKCAGMPDRAKNLFIMSITREFKDMDKLDKEEREFVETKHTWDDFKAGKWETVDGVKIFTGLVVPGVLKSKNVPGGVLLSKGKYYMREKIL